MKENEKSLLIAEAENVEAIRDFFAGFWSSADLYESAAKVGSIILFLARKKFISDVDLEELQSMLEQHIMMIDVIKPFERKEESV